MITVALGAGIVVLIFSLYQLLVSDDSMALGVNLLRVILTLLGLAAIRFDESIVLTTSVLLFALISILVLAISRNEVQIKND